MRPTDEQTRQRVQRLREQTGLSVRDIARQVGISVPTVQKILRNNLDTFHKSQV